MAITSGASTNRTLSPVSIVKGLGTALVWELVLASAIGAVYYFVSFSESLVNGLLLASNAVALVAGGIHAAKESKNQGWLHGSIMGFTYCLALWSMQSMGLVQSASMSVSAFVLAAIGTSVVGGIGGIIGMATSD